VTLRPLVDVLPQPVTTQLAKKSGKRERSTQIGATSSLNSIVELSLTNAMSYRGRSVLKISFITTSSTCRRLCDGSWSNILWAPTTTDSVLIGRALPLNFFILQHSDDIHKMSANIMCPKQNINNVTK